ncbi:unnamed protein product [Linum trigynum]|uniref:Uncharacterized protein n=1 Tax=Linum trigynum TaxID=586398 RepID=A0AAV2F758_9ROSI
MESKVEQLEAMLMQEMQLNVAARQELRRENVEARVAQLESLLRQEMELNRAARQELRQENQENFAATNALLDQLFAPPQGEEEPRF